MARVNRPTDPQEKDREIDQKLKLYGIYKALSNGKLPTNKQCDVALNSVLKSRPLSSPPKELSADGKQIVSDLREVIIQAKRLFLPKNEGELLQEFIWNAQHIGGAAMPQPDGPAIEKDTLRQDVNEAFEGMKTLGTLLITNGEFRKLLSDATILLRDITGDAAQKVASTVRPSQEQLSQIDKPAEENVFYDKPNVSKEGIQSQAQSQAEKYRPAAEGTAASVSQATTGGQRPTSASDVNVGAGARSLGESVSQNIPQEAKDRTGELAERTRSYFEEKMPPELRDQVAWRFRKMIVEIQGHSEYQKAIETLLTLAERYVGHVKQTSQKSAGTMRCARMDQNLQSAQTNLRILVERFANCTSMDDFFEALNNIYRDADRDPELRHWFKHLNAFIRECLREKGYVMRDEATQEWNELYDDGRFLLRERYRDDVRRVVDEITFFAGQFAEDPQNTAFANALQKLFKDLGSAQGYPVFKKHLVRDLRNVVLPAIFENTRYVPMPRIEVSDPMVDVVVENLILESDNMMPNVVEFGSDNYWRWGRKKISNKSDNKIMISVSGIQADLRDVSYYIKKKQGFPSISDTGVMDIFLGDDGFSFKIAASSAQQKDRQNFFKVDRVAVRVHNINIRLKKSKHKVLFAVFKPLLFRVVRPALQLVMEKQIRDAFAKADAFAYEVHQEAQRARESVRRDPANAPNIYSQYADATRRKLMEKKQRAEAAGAQRDTKMQLAATHDDSMFKDIKLPGGITNKATEYKELALKGERWQSPVFDIGKASPSKDLPKLPPITRKPHATAAGGLRERERETASKSDSDGRPVSPGVQSTTASGVTGNNTDGYPVDGTAKAADERFKIYGPGEPGQKGQEIPAPSEGPTVPGTPTPMETRTA
ncbi:hypothetical protein VTN02DRAFT_4460 [Thermoascus thermophilus]